MQPNRPKCYACDRPLSGKAAEGAYAVVVKGEDPQYRYWLGADCHKRVAAAGSQGYQPPKGGPVLVLPPEGRP